MLLAFVEETNLSEKHLSKHIDVLFVLRWFVSAKVMLVTLEKSQLYHSSS
jgi:hypothetical protein